MLDDLGSISKHVVESLQFHQNAVLDLVSQTHDDLSVRSQMADEIASCPESESLREAFWSAQRAVFQNSVDHIDSICRALTPPILAFSPWMSARCVLEQCSIAYWLSEIEIDSRERLCRILNVRLRNIKESRKWTRLANDFGMDPSKDGGKAHNDRVSHLRIIAKNCGVSEKTSTKGDFLGFGNGMPHWTNLARDAFDAEELYRLLSGSTHGQFWTSSLSIGGVEGSGEGSQEFGPRMESWVPLLIGVYVIEWFSKACWNVFAVSGWDMRQLAAIFEEAYDELAVNPEHRFWRHDRLLLFRP